MNRYPLSVFLDTNIFIGCRYDLDDSGLLFLLKNQVDKKKIKIYMSNIALKETVSHIKLDISNAISAWKKINKEVISKKIAPAIVKDSDFSNIFKIPDIDETQKIAVDNLKDFLDKANVIYLDNTGIDINEILEDYFNERPPFENKESKKNEFPDAFMISKLKREFNHDNPVCVITGDNGFKASLEGIKGFNCLSSIKELLDMINKEEKIYEDIVRFVNQDSNEEMCIKIKEEIESNEILVNGLDYDRQGYFDGYEYFESTISDVHIENVKLSSVDKINEDKVHLTVSCKATIFVNCFYNDYDNAIWDNEENEYMFLSQAQMYEEHETEFECSLSIDIKYDENTINFSKINILSYDLVLDQYSRTHREESELSDDILDARSEMMEALEEYYKH